MGSLGDMTYTLTRETKRVKYAIMKKYSMPCVILSRHHGAPKVPSRPVKRRLVDHFKWTRKMNQNLLKSATKAFAQVMMKIPVGLSLVCLKYSSCYMSQSQNDLQKVDKMIYRVNCYSSLHGSACNPECLRRKNYR